MKVFWDVTSLLHDPPHEILSGRLVQYLECPDRLQRIKTTLQQDDAFEIIPVQSDDWPKIRTYILSVHSEDYLDYLETIYDEWTAVGGDKTAVFPETFRHHRLQSLTTSQDVKNLSPLAKPGKLSMHRSVHYQYALRPDDVKSAGNYCFDMSCPITSDTYRAAIASVKVTLSAARALADSDHSQVCGVFALARPPGHHAQDSLCGGYCFLNNVAIAAKYFLEHGGSHRVAILDVDYHHGNGTQQMFYSDPQVVYVSLHAQGDYPYFTGAAEERGSGPGIGYNHNFPLPTGTTTDDVYCATLQNAVDVIRGYTGIDYILVSLGVDTYADDPICDFLLTTSCYPRIGRLVASLGKPTLFVMEGGYHLETLGENVRGVLRGFESEVRASSTAASAERK